LSGARRPPLIEGGIESDRLARDPPLRSSRPIALDGNLIAPDDKLSEFLRVGIEFV